ncbi:MAG: type II toxin-antitoxin system VapC family toxin [Flavobacteriales bacterium]|nr:type II toxin-antitoxin system VapC family toxin [Flavobacteriales bacterium]
MRVLLDTHILLWGQAGDPALPKEAERAIKAEGNEAWVSVVSFWEIGLKHSFGKLPLHIPLEAFFQTILDAHFMVLPDPAHTLPHPSFRSTTAHPFDRMLIAQAMHEGMHRSPWMRSSAPTTYRSIGLRSSVLMEAMKYCSLEQLTAAMLEVGGSIDATCSRGASCATS